MSSLARWLVLPVHGCRAVDESQLDHTFLCVQFAHDCAYPLSLSALGLFDWAHYSDIEDGTTPHVASYVRVCRQLLKGRGRRICLYLSSIVRAQIILICSIICCDLHVLTLLYHCYCVPYLQLNFTQLLYIYHICALLHVL